MYTNALRTGIDLIYSDATMRVLLYCACEVNFGELGLSLFFFLIGLITCELVVRFFFFFGFDIFCLDDDINTMSRVWCNMFGSLLISSKSKREQFHSD